MVVLTFRTAEIEGVVGIDVVVNPGDDPPGILFSKPHAFQQSREWRKPRRVDGNQSALVLDREAGFSKGGVGGTGDPQLSSYVERRRRLVVPWVEEALLLFEDQGMMVHASGGEKVDQRCLCVAPFELGLEGTLLFDG